MAEVTSAQYIADSQARAQAIANAQQSARDAVTNSTNANSQTVSLAQQKARDVLSNSVNANALADALAKQKARDALSNTINTNSQSTANAQQVSRDAIINGQLGINVTNENNNTGDVNAQYTTQETGIRSDTYNNIENLKAGNTMKGIQFSQQGDALTQGATRAGEGLIVGAKSTRDLALNNIKARITALQANAGLQLGASSSQKNTDVNNANGINNASLEGSLYQQQSDTTTANNTNNASLQGSLYQQQSDSTTANQTANGLLQSSKATAQGNVLLAVDGATKIATQHDWDVSAQKKAFDNEVSLRAIDQKDKIAIQNLGFAQQQTLFNMTEASKAKFYALDKANQRDMLVAQEASQTRLADAQAGREKVAYDAQSADQKALAVQDGVRKFILSDPSFPYAGVTNKTPQQTANLKAFANSYGMDSKTQDLLGVNGSTLTPAKANIIGASSVWKSLFEGMRTISGGMQTFFK